MSGPTLSVIMPNYNYERYIGQALDALISQSYPLLEIIVVDDASTDGSVGVIEKYAGRYPNVRLLKNEKNLGVIRSQNRAIEMVRGDYFYSAGSDDMVLPGFLERSMRLLADNPDAALCCTDIRIAEDGRERDIRLHLSDRPVYFPPEKALKVFGSFGFTPVLSNTAVFKRSDLLEAGGFDPSLLWSADSFVINVMSFRHGFCYVPEVLTMARVHKSQYGRSMASQSDKERKLVRKIMDTVMEPEYADVLPAFRKTAPFSSHPYDTFRAVMSSGKYRGFLSIKLVKFALDDVLRRMMIAVLPVRVTRAVQGCFNALRRARLAYRK